MAHPDESQSSASDVQRQPAKHRRVRKALSCTQCKERKIRCDRRVPGCSSCMARGIQNTCRWGDERDDEKDGIDQRPVSTPKRREKRMRNDSDGDESSFGAIVEAAVEVAVKKLKGRRTEPISGRARASTATKSAKRLSIHDTIYIQTSCPPPAASANLASVSAFHGARIYHPIRGITLPTEQHLDADLIRSSLRILPRRAVFDRLIDIYLEEVEPYRQSFNRVILRKQLDEFWRGVDELGVRPDSIAALQAKRSGSKAGGGAVRMLNIWFNADECVSDDPAQSFFLCNHVRQGLLAVVFALVDSATRSMSLSRLKELEVVAQDTTREEASAWCLDVHRHAMQHLSMSNYLQQPTIWSLQTLLMQHCRWLDTPNSDRCLAVLGVAVSLAINMGLNRLGSAYNDLETMSIFDDLQRASDSRSPSKAKLGAAATAAVSSGRPASLLSDSRYGASLSVFEEGDLALRELGRKVWCCLVWVDWTMAGHMDHFYCAHDGINHTAPPAPVDDDEILSPKAPFALAKARMGIHHASDNEVIGLRMALARAARVQTDLENEKGYSLAYEDIMMVDDGFCEVIEMVPEYLQLKSRRHKSPPGGVHIFSSAPLTKQERLLQMQACMLQDQIHFRRLRLHRMSFGKGLKEVRYRPSVLACMQAARVILAVRRQVEEDKVRMWSTFVLQSHLFHAALVLHLVLLYEMDRMRAVSAGGHNGHADAFDDDDAYVLDDFDATLQQLDEAVGFLQSSEQSHFSRDLLPGLATFLSGVQEYNDRQKLAKIRAQGRAKERAGQTHHRTSGKERSQDSHTDAATTLASIPMLDADETQWPRPASKHFAPLNRQSDTMSQEFSGIGSTPNTSISSLSPHSLMSWPVVAPFSLSQQQQHGAFAGPLNDASSGTVVAAQSAKEAYDPSIWSLEALFPDYAAGEVDLIAALEQSFFGGATNGPSDVLRPESAAFAAPSAPPQWPDEA